MRPFSISRASNYDLLWMIEFPCQVCQTPLRANDAQAGQLVRCPTCSTTLRVPVPAGAATANAVARAYIGSGPSPVVRGSGRRYGFNCGYCSSRLEATESMAAQEGQCPTCGKRFAFEPRDGARITDLGFKRAIDAVSANGHVSWGVEHLYYEVGRRIRRARRWKSRLPWVALALDALLIAIAATNSRWGWVIVLALVGIGTSRWALGASRKTMPLSLDAFTKMWATWTRVHSDRTKGLIIRKEPLPRPRPVEGDIALYSFDRAVICDRARTVDLLLANNFHFENNCAVLSIDGYPPGPFDTVRAMLKRNPRLQVFALHDATEAGCRMAYRLAAEAEWFKGQATVVDVGLRPVHAPAFAGLLLEPSGGRVEPGRGISGDEAQ